MYVPAQVQDCCKAGGWNAFTVWGLGCTAGSATQDTHVLCHVRALHKARMPSKAMACRDRLYLAA